MSGPRPRARGGSAPRPKGPSRPTPRTPLVERLTSYLSTGRSRRAEAPVPHSPEEQQERRRLRRRRLVRRTVVVIIALVVLDAAWIGSRALLARGHLLKAKDLVAQAQDEVRAGHLQNALAIAAKVQKQASAADSDSSDPLWNLTASLPLVGHSLTDISGIASAVDDVSGQILPQLAAAASDLKGDKLRRSDGSINVASLTNAGAKLQIADSALIAAQNRVAALPKSLVLSPVGSARNQLAGQIASLRTEFAGATVATKLAPGMLGANGRRTYFLALENSAEARGSGGIIGGFAVDSISDGKLQPLSQKGGDAQFPVYSGKPTTVLPADDVARWGSFGPSEDLRNSNISPNFPWAVDAIAGLYKRHFGGTLDGVIALDPTAAGYILGATGPVTLADGTVLNSGNLTSYVESTLYVKYDSPDVNTARLERQDALTGVTTAIFEALIRGQGDPVALLAALGRADGEGRLLIGSTHPDEEKLLTSTLVGGAIPATTAPYSSVALVNSSGDKLDYYLDRTVTWSGGACTGATRSTTVTAVLTNNAPRSGLPAYVNGALTVADQTGQVASFRGQAGTSNLPPPYTVGEYVSVYGTTGGTPDTVTVDGTPITFVTQSEVGHPVVSFYITLPPGGGKRTIVVHWTEPTTGGAPQFRVQPLVRPQISKVTLQACR